MTMLSEKTLKEVRRLRPKRVLLQVPEGLKAGAQGFAAEIEGMGAEVFIGCDPCFGACDIRDSEAQRLGCDLIVHVGHSSLGVKSGVPVIYEHFYLKTDAAGAAKRHARSLNEFKRVGLVTTLQYAGCLEGVKKVLEREGFEVYVNKNRASGVAGQVLGCEHGAALNMEKQVDCFLFVGTGRFHPLGVAVVTEKPVFFLDLECGRLVDLRGEAEKERVKSRLSVEKARSCKAFGILVSTKPGQARPEEALQLKRLLERKGKKAWILAMDRITPEAVMGVDVDCLVNTACPRLREDAGMFKKPLINPGECREL